MAATKRPKLMLAAIAGSWAGSTSTGVAWAASTMLSLAALYETPPLSNCSVCGGASGRDSAVLKWLPWRCSASPSRTMETRGAERLGGDAVAMLSVPVPPSAGVVSSSSPASCSCRPAMSGCRARAHMVSSRLAPLWEAPRRLELLASDGARALSRERRAGDNSGCTHRSQRGRPHSKTSPGSPVLPAVLPRRPAIMVELREKAVMSRRMWPWNSARRRAEGSRLSAPRTWSPSHPVHSDARNWPREMSCGPAMGRVRCVSGHSCANVVRCVTMRDTWSPSGRRELRMMLASATCTTGPRVAQCRREVKGGTRSGVLPVAPAGRRVPGGDKGVAASAAPAPGAALPPASSPAPPDQRGTLPADSDATADRDSTCAPSDTRGEWLHARSSFSAAWGDRLRSARAPAPYSFGSPGALPVPGAPCVRMRLAGVKAGASHQQAAGDSCMRAVRLRRRRPSKATRWAGVGSTPGTGRGMRLPPRTPCSSRKALAEREGGVESGGCWAGAGRGTTSGRPCSAASMRGPGKGHHAGGMAPRWYSKAVSERMAAAACTARRSSTLHTSTAELPPRRRVVAARSGRHPSSATYGTSSTPERRLRCRPPTRRAGWRVAEVGRSAGGAVSPRSSAAASVLVTAICTTRKAEQEPTMTAEDRTGAECTERRGVAPVARATRFSTVPFTLCTTVTFFSRSAAMASWETSPEHSSTSGCRATSFATHRRM